jgi:DNA helicase II / ATP-dependent DNA helicase PcrA
MSDPYINFEDRFKKLNPEQRKAVETIEGPLLVVAGPGSGKTEILSMRVAEILLKTHAQPSHILCLTFTESASINMCDRLARLIGDPAYKVGIHTFHNFCVDIIRKHGEFFYHGATFAPADEIFQVSVLESIFNSLAYDNPLRSFHPKEGYVYLKSALSSISHIKKAGLTPDEFEILISDNQEGIKAIESHILPTLEKRLGKQSIDDIADMLAKVTDICAMGAKKRRLDCISDCISALEGSQKGGVVSESIKHIFSLYKPIEEAVILSLTEAIAAARETGKNDAISNWKKKWLRKDENGTTIFRDQAHEDKMFSLAQIYRLYQKTLYQNGYFDFDDMILDVIKVLYEKPELRYMLQEQYQYVLVDEFQDTNNAQMRILTLLTESEMSNGRPNIMVVGDDDQAIYKFQGAELSNILDFQHRYQDVSLVSLVRNYRSTQPILDMAMQIIRKGEKRLENLIPDLSKQLVAGGVFEKGHIEYVSLETPLHEYTYVAHTIERLIKQEGIEPKDIAVIARKHGQLESLVPHMRKVGIPIKYEREQNVFDEPHIHELITIARYISSLVSAFDYTSPQEELMPEILSYAFWGIPRIEIWRISLAVSRQQKTWLEVMLESEHEKVKQIAEFLVELAGEAPSAPLERMLDRIIGAHISLTAEGDDVDQIYALQSSDRKADKRADKEGGEEGGTEERKESTKAEGNKRDTTEFISPFRQFYFSKEKFSHARSEYLTFLSSLRVFVQALRDFSGMYSTKQIGDLRGDATALKTKVQSSTDDSMSEGESISGILRLIDLVTFVDMYQKNGLRLNDRSPFITARNAVELMSAHASKGLEYKAVFVLSCQDDIWAGKGRINKISFPMNISIEPAGENEDDQLRLFYVALTRAKERLYLTAHQIKESGKPAQDLRFLVGVKEVDISKTASEEDVLITPEVLETTALQYRTASFIDSEEMLLHSVLEHYSLSVTHLNNFINIPKGGPAYFLEQNILRFPQGKNISGAYGSAIHNTLEYITHTLKDKNKLPGTDDIISTYAVFLKKQKLHPSDFKLLNERGVHALKCFMNEKSDEFSTEDIPEMDFGRDHIVIDTVKDALGANRPVRITGKIDKVSIQGDSIVVHDYKTGGVISSLIDPAADEAEKALFYGNQLKFYKLLIAQAPHTEKYAHLKGKRVDLGVIDFIEPVGKKHEIVSTSLPLVNEDIEQLKLLIKAVYTRIVNLQFEIPTEIAKKYVSGGYTKDIDVIQDFIGVLLRE